jgi:hypothetical protein
MKVQPVSMDWEEIPDPMDWEEIPDPMDWEEIRVRLE